MKMLKDWKDIARKAWSIRLMLTAGLLSGAEVILPMFMDDMPRNVFAVLSMLVITGAMISRLVAQKGLSE